MTGSHEVRGSIPLGSTKNHMIEIEASIKDFVADGFLIVRGAVAPSRIRRRRPMTFPLTTRHRSTSFVFMCYYSRADRHQIAFAGERLITTPTRSLKSYRKGLALRHEAIGIYAVSL
jgi:hypothetical protein